MLHFYTCRMFTSRQGLHESSASWSNLWEKRHRCPLVQMQQCKKSNVLCRRKKEVSRHRNLITGPKVASKIGGNPCVNMLKGSRFMFKGSGRGSSFANRQLNRENRPIHPERRVRVDAKGIAGLMSTCWQDQCLRELSVFYVQSLDTRHYTKRDKSAWRRRNNVGNDMAGRENSSFGPQK
jgi:hypothetical protein